MTTVKLIKNIESSDDIIEFVNYVEEVTANLTDITISQRIESFSTVAFRLVYDAYEDTNDGGYQNIFTSTSLM